MVEALLDRVANEILTEDRKESLLQLRDLLATGSPVALATFGEIGYPVVNGILRDERQDAEMVQVSQTAHGVRFPCPRPALLQPPKTSPLQAALDTLYQATTAQPAPSSDLDLSRIPDVAAINSEVYARG